MTLLWSDSVHKIIIAAGKGSRLGKDVSKERSKELKTQQHSTRSYEFWPQYLLSKTLLKLLDLEAS